MLTIISGGQTGADRTALEVARELGIATGGTAPHGWKTEDGAAPDLADFGLKESPFLGYRLRTRANVRDSDVTIWFGTTGSPGHTATYRACRDFGKPFVENLTVDSLVLWLARWLPRCINVAGNRRSTNPAVVTQVRDVLKPALLQYLELLARPSPVDSSPAEERIEAEEAISSVAANTSDEWREAALCALRTVAECQPHLTTEDIWRRLRTQDSPQAHNNKAMGPVMRSAAALGWITLAGRTSDAEQMSHGRPLRVWRSLLCGD